MYKEINQESVKIESQIMPFINNVVFKLDRPPAASLTIQNQTWSSFERRLMILHEEDIHQVHEPSES